MNQMLCSAGMSVWSCISGLRMLITMNTVAISVEKESIQRNLQRKYVKSPAKSIKSEYHRRVSPMVRNGGRSRVIHSEAMKSTKRAIAVALHAMAMLLLSRLHSAKTAEESESRNTATATQGNMFQPNSMLLNWFICHVAWSANKEHHRTRK